MPHKKYSITISFALLHCIDSVRFVNECMYKLAYKSKIVIIMYTYLTDSTHVFGMYIF